MTYTFIIEAGDNPEDEPNYHPFYITDSEDGGILLDSPEDRMVSILKLLISLFTFQLVLNHRERMKQCSLVMIWIPTNLLLVCLYMLNANNPITLACLYFQLVDCVNTLKLKIRLK